VRRLWAESAPAYAELALELPTYQVSNQRLVEALELQPGHRVLDLACGSGATLEAVFAAQPEIDAAWAVDWVEEMVEQARARLAGRPVRFAVAPAQDFARCLAGERVDRVLSNGAFFQFDQPGRVLAEVARVLAPGGRLGVTLPGPSNTLRFLALFHHLGLTRPLAGGPPGMPPGERPRRLGADNAGALLAEAGWVLETRERVVVPTSQEDYIRWMSLPVFRRPEWMGWPQEKLETKLRQALERTDLQPEVSWVVVIARPRRDAAAPALTARRGRR
jgi:SAM-dependent methyltransferase